MDSTAIAEVVRRVEQAPLRDLVNVPIDDVMTQLDSYASDPDLDSSSLYRRWETQPWAVSDLDFETDKAHWAAITEAQREFTRRTMVLFFIGEQAVTDTLSPLLYAAPHEDERIFLATQIADEARHSVFFVRFFEEVIGVGGGLHAALESVGPGATSGFRQIFEHELVDAVERVRLNPKDMTAWVEGLVTYHLVIEGFLALAGQRNLLRFFRAMGLMPGFVAGFTAVARDESRHVGYGVLALRRRVRENPELGRVIARKLLELAEPAVRTAIAPERRLVLRHPAEVPAELRQSPLEGRDFQLASLEKRMRGIGLSPGVIAEIVAHWSSQFDLQWAEYEANHGERHPVRWYQEQERLGTPA